MAKTLEFWKHLINGEYETYVSELVIAEFNNCIELKKSKIEGLLRQAPIAELEIDDEVTELADRYMTEGLFPNKYCDDAIY